MSTKESTKPTEQEEGARVRLEHALANLDMHVQAIKSHVKDDIPTSGIRQNLVMAAQTVAELLAVIDAFRFQREGHRN